MAFLAGCGSNDGPTIFAADPRPDAGCLRNEAPTDYNVYFVLDVSGSMTPYLSAMQKSMLAFAESFPDVNERGEHVTVDYYVVGFVNDVRWFPSPPNDRMSSPAAVEASIQTAIHAGENNKNLSGTTYNAEPTENLLDALMAVVQSKPDAQANLVVIATDSAFAEAPTELSGSNIVKANYKNTKKALEDLGVRVHAYVPSDIPGISVSYGKEAALTTLPGSTVQRLDQFKGSANTIQESLKYIAREAACK